MQKEFKYALDVFDEFPESQISVIPVRLDDCEISYQNLRDIAYTICFLIGIKDCKGLYKQ